MTAACWSCTWLTFPHTPLPGCGRIRGSMHPASHSSARGKQEWLAAACGAPNNLELSLQHCDEHMWDCQLFYVTVRLTALPSCHWAAMQRSHSEAVRRLVGLHEHGWLHSLPPHSCSRTAERGPLAMPA